MAKRKPAGKSTFIFAERTVSFPTFEIEAGSLAEACRTYAKLTTDGAPPDNEECHENVLAEVRRIGKPDQIIAQSKWQPLVDRAIDQTNRESPR